MNGVTKQSVVRAVREQQRLHDNGRWFFHRRHRQPSSTEDYSVSCSADWRLGQIARCNTKAQSEHSGSFVSVASFFVRV